MDRAPDSLLVSSRKALVVSDGYRAFMSLRAGAEAPHVRVTVAVPMYNVAPYVGDTIRSLLRQSHQNLSLWLLDDASTDDTVHEARKAAAGDWRVKIFHFDQNRGPYALKNWALKTAKTQFVAFQDGDDIAHRHRIRLQLGAMRWRGAAASTVRWDRVDEGGTTLVIDGKKARMAANSLMIERASILPAVGYFDRTRMAADTEYLGRIDCLMPRGSLIRLPEVGISGLLRGGSITTKAGSGMEWQRSGQHVTRKLSGPRQAYLDAAKAWHASDQVHRVAYDAQSAPFSEDIERVAAIDPASDQVQVLTP